MLISLLFAMLALDAGDTTAFRMEDAFEPLLRSDIAIADDGEVFILDFQLSKISRFDRNGKLLNTISKKGPGPGEIGFPNGIFLWQNRIHVSDRASGSIKQFEKDGDFVDETRLPARGVTVVKVAGGWITANLLSRQPDKPIDINWMNEKMAEPKKIASWPRPANAGGMMMVRSSGAGKPKMPYNPVRENALIIADRDGKTVYIYIPGSPKIHVIDAAKKKVVDSISREIEQIPFNEEYGNRKLAEVKEARKGMPVDFVADFPQNFPAVREIFISAENKLGVRRWTAYPSKSKKNLVMDVDGTDVKLAYQENSARQVLLVQGEMAYINCFQADEERAFVLKVPVSAIDKAVAANPFDFSLEQPRMMMMTR